MNIGDLYIDPADGLLMLYVGVDPEQSNHYGFFCPTVTWHPDGHYIYYYSNYDLKYLEKIDENTNRNID